jgi:hypothetical protein
LRLYRLTGKESWVAAARRQAAAEAWRLASGVGDERGRLELALLAAELIAPEQWTPAPFPLYARASANFASMRR